MSIWQGLHSLLKLDMSQRRGLLLSFLVGFAVRLIPELLAYPYPIGYDTVHYLAVAKNGLAWSHWSSVFSTWLLYAVLSALHSLLQVDPVLLVKLVAPLLYALNACGIYYFTKRVLGWDARPSLVAALFFVFQLAAFRISWDLLRNALGMAILLFALPFVVRFESKKDLVWFAVLSLLVVFCHELTSVVMFAMVIGGIILREGLNRNTPKLLKVSAAILPALIVFSASMYFRVFPVGLGVETNVVNAVEPVAHPGGLFFLANYFVGSSSGFYTSYFDLASHVFSVFIVLYLLCLPLVLVGFFRNRVLDAWTVFLACASFGCLVLPVFAFDLWDRWMFLLVYPLSLYAVNGLLEIFQSADGVVRPRFGRLRWMRVSKGTAVGLLFGMLLLTSFYVGATLQSDNYVVFSIPTISRYFSVAPTVPLRDVEGIVQVMEWLNGHMHDGSCVLVHAAFLEWAHLHLDGSHTLITYSADIEEALDVATSNGFSRVYLVWWGESIGWYWVTVPGCFRAVFESGRMAAFEYSLLRAD